MGKALDHLTQDVSNDKKNEMMPANLMCTQLANFIKASIKTESMFAEIRRVSVLNQCEEALVLAEEPRKASGKS